MTIEQLYIILEKFVKANPHLWGAAIGFEPFVYPEYGEKGVAPFLRHTNDTLYERLDLPTMENDYRNDDWYKTTKELGKPRWCLPFVDVKGEVISCFCIPIYLEDGSFFGAIAVDMMLKNFADELKKEIQPYKGAEVMVIGPGNKFLVHPNHNYEMNIESTITELEEKTKKNDATLFHHTMDSDDMTVAVSCPNNAIYSEIDDLLHHLLWYSAIGLLIVEIICLITFFQVRRVVESKASIEGELTIASNIQMSMLPMLFPAFPERKDIDLFASLKPAKSVGGDLYDFILSKNDMGHDTLVFTIGDVSGKGVPAALLMAVVCSLFRDVASKSTDPKVILTDINDCISQRNEYNMFCTMFIGSLDLETGKIDYCNAGHNQPVLIKNGQANFVEVKPNIPLGSFSGFEYESETAIMDDDDMLFIYTDGVTESENVLHKEFSDEKLLEVLNQTVSKKTINVIDEVAKSVMQFVGKADQSDDITMLAVRKNKIV